MTLRLRRLTGTAVALALAGGLAVATPGVAAPRGPVKADVTGNGVSDLVVGTFDGAHYDPDYVFFRDFKNGRRGQSPAVTQDGPDIDSLGSTLAHCNTDGDRYADVVSSLWRTREGRRGGQWGIQVLRGGGPDLGFEPGASITQAQTRSSPRDLGGIACGDVNGDGIDEIAVGRPYETVRGRGEAGVVWVYPGTGTGPSAAKRTVTQEWPGLVGASEYRDEFGAAVAFADLDDDGYDDLVVGAPKENAWYDHDDCRFYCGAVSVIFGSKAGLSKRTRLFDGHKLGVYGSFGSELAIGDINGDGRDDIVVSVPRHFVPVVRPGAFAVILGAPRTKLRINQVVNQADPGIPGTAETGNNFGVDLAVGDVNGDSRDDVVTTSVQTVGGKPSGAVFVLPGARSGVSRLRAQRTTLRSPGVPGDPLEGDRLGGRVTALDTSGDGRAEIYVTGSLKGSKVFYRFTGSGSGANPRGTGVVTWPEILPDQTVLTVRYAAALVR